MVIGSRICAQDDFEVDVKAYIRSRLEHLRMRTVRDAYERPNITYSAARQLKLSKFLTSSQRLDDLLTLVCQ
jgi:hypothetical protein